MVTCTCGKTIEKVPDWFQNVSVEFVCNNCPNRSLKNIAIVSMEIDKKLAGAATSAATLAASEDAPFDPDDEE
ncbi:MAG: hypothetical protein SFX74_09475 [Fimbriimonadaceae bacterium]|nr:hypothetical protein [Fimbriimonadaceae bacterium]